MRSGSRARRGGVLVLLGGLGLWCAWWLLGGSPDGVSAGDVRGARPAGDGRAPIAETAPRSGTADRSREPDAAAPGAASPQGSSAAADGPWRIPFRVELDRGPLPGGVLALRRVDGPGEVTVTADGAGEGELLLASGLWELLPVDPRLVADSHVSLEAGTDSFSHGCDGARAGLAAGEGVDPDADDALAVVTWSPTPGARLTVRWTSPLDVQGVVLGPDGAPYPGAEVRFTSYGSESGDLGTTLTDATGAFSGRLPGVSFDLLRAQVEARAPGLAPAWAEIRDRKLVLRLRVACALEGVVRDEAGRPLPARVTVSWSARGPAGAVDCAQATACDASGRFRLDGIPEGAAASSNGQDRNVGRWEFAFDHDADGAGPRAAAVQVSARLRGYLPGHARAVTRPGAPGRVELVLAAAQVIRVRVCEPDGAALNGAHCRRVSESFDVEKPLGPDDRCDERGERELTLGVGESVFVHVGAPGYQDAVFELAGAGPHELRLERAAVPVTGRVLEADGRPARFQGVFARLPGRAGRFRTGGGAAARRLGLDELGGVRLAQGRTDARGAFALPGAPEGVALRIECQDASCELEPGQRQVELRRPAPVAPPAEGTARLRVVADEDGRPLTTGVSVEVDTSEEEADAREGESAGEWLLGGYGPVNARVFAPGRVAQTLSCTLVTGREQELGEVRLARGARLCVDLRWLGALRGAQLTWATAGGRGGGSGPTADSTAQTWWLSAPGEERTEPVLLPWGLPPGVEITVTLRAEPFGQPLEATPRQTWRFTCAAGETRTLSCELR